MSFRPDLSVALVVGRPPESDASHCGVRDYATRLAEALRAAGVEADVVAPPGWGPGSVQTWLRDLRDRRFDMLHLQYPSMGHRRSLLPHLLGLSSTIRRFVVTLHEHSALPLAQRLANQLFRATAERLVFTTAFEARAFGTADAPVIAIGSNVPALPESGRRDLTVMYFGQIRPGKGIEQFVALAQLSQEGGEPFQFLVMGSTPPRWRDYADGFRVRLPCNTRWQEDAPFEGVARAMAGALAAYLPFPDGASLRRGSLLAALSNGLPVISPVDAATPLALRDVLLAANTRHQALAQARTLRDVPGLAMRQGAASREAVRPFGWPTIAERHITLYRALMPADESGAVKPCQASATGAWPIRKLYTAHVQERR